MLKDILILMACGFGFLFILLTLLWLIQKRTNNAGIVDVLWAFSFPLLTSIYCISTETDFNKKLILLGMVWIWGGRLGIHLFARNHKGPEDVRYKQLRIEWGGKQQSKMFRFFQFQGLLATILSLPFALIAYNAQAEFSFLEIAAITLWAIGVVGETIADWQLKKFKNDPGSKGKVCQTGLWNYSRHPNYFFEWVIWIAWFVFALSYPYGWISIICPLFMLYFLTKVTGIPMTEELSVKSKGEAYKKYQRSTSAFIPWFKNK